MIPQGADEVIKQIQPSRSGTGAGVYEVLQYSQVDQLELVRGEITSRGTVAITGTRIYNLGDFIDGLGNDVYFQSLAVNGKNWKDFKNNLHWSDQYAIALVRLKPKVRHPNILTEGWYEVGTNIYLKDFDLGLIVSEIEASGGAKDWNNTMTAKFPAVDDTKQPESPFNEESPYYDLSKPVFSYDTDGYIIYKSGEVIFTETGAGYYDKTNGGAMSYDKVNKIVTFENGNKLNLLTLELTRPDNTVKTVTTGTAWYRDFKTVKIIVLALLAVILGKWILNREDD